MPEVKRWSGNDTTEISLYDTELDSMVTFIKKHNNVFVFGKGKIGNALFHYLKEAKMEIAGQIDSKDLEYLHKVYEKGKVGIVLGISDVYFPEVLPLLSAVEKDDIYILPSVKREMLGNIFSLENVKKNFWINIFTTNKCNLNCKSCSSFAPICKAEFYAPEQFEKDMLQLKNLRLPIISVIKFTGGEPFLNPYLFKIFEIAREIFPDIPMECYTNGLLLGGLSNEKCKALDRLKITLVITEYPLENISLKKIYEKLDAFSVSYYVIYSEGQKYFSKRPLNLKKDTPNHLFCYCPRYKMCDSLFLFKGRLYKCIYVLTSEYVNEAFGLDLRMTERDFLDIYRTTPAEIYEFAISRLDFCGYCSPIEEKVPWGLSERKIEEWT